MPPSHSFQQRGPSPSASAADGCFGSTQSVDQEARITLGLLVEKCDRQNAVDEFEAKLIDHEVPASGEVVDKLREVFFEEHSPLDTTLDERPCVAESWKGNSGAQRL